MYDFSYMKPASLADAVKALGGGRRQGAGRRHDAHSGAETAPEQARRRSSISTQLGLVGIKISGDDRGRSAR